MGVRCEVIWRVGWPPAMEVRAVSQWCDVGGGILNLVVASIYGCHGYSSVQMFYG